MNLHDGEPAISNDLHSAERRVDLVPDLVSGVRSYTARERETLDAVTQVRTVAVAAQSRSRAVLGRDNIFDGLRSQIFLEIGRNAL
jgi:hypothetical protein